MSLSMAPLLMHSEHVPAMARAAIRAAYAAPPARRRAELESAAKMLHHETGVAYDDARELIGLSHPPACALI